MYNITVAHGHSSIEVLHSLTPLILASKEIKDWNWSFVDYKIKNLFKKQGDLLILVRKYHSGKISNEDIILELIKLRKNFNKIVYFDDSASSTSIFFCTFPYVDQYWKRSQLLNTDLYKKKFYGGHLFSDYYHEKFKINDGNQVYFNPIIDNESDLNKLKISWNIGVGIFPLNKFNPIDYMHNTMRKAITAMSILPSLDPIYYFILNQFSRMKKELNKEVVFHSRKKKISSRFKAFNYRNSIGFQRKLIIKNTFNNKLFLSGEKTKKEFIQETHDVLGLLSPYGWGEICYRDFEAALGGSLLIKPNMSHIKTWPNIYLDDMYHSLKWDLTDLNLLENLLDNQSKYEVFVNNTRNKYLESLKNCVNRCTTMIEKVI